MDRGWRPREFEPHRLRKSTCMNRHSSIHKSDFSKYGGRTNSLLYNYYTHTPAIQLYQRRVHYPPRHSLRAVPEHSRPVREAPAAALKTALFRTCPYQYHSNQLLIKDRPTSRSRKQTSTIGLAYTMARTGTMNVYRLRGRCEFACCS